MSYQANIQKAYDTIVRADNILLITHRDPDSDAFGSALALSYWLSEISKPHRLYSLDVKVNTADFLTAENRIDSVWENVSQEKFDVVVIVDSSDLNITGIEKNLREYQHSPTIINIDHHISNTNYGDINLVVPDAASTTEIVYRFFKNQNVTLNRDIANCLLIGILGDTNNFTNPNASGQTFEITSNLIQSGASLAKMHRLNFPKKNLSILKMWGTVLDRITVNQEWGIAYTIVTREEQAKVPNSELATMGLTNFLNQLSGVKMVLVLFEQEDGKIKGSFRTNHNLIDVSLLATMLGGGGHRRAAGFTLNGKLKQSTKGWQLV